MKNVTIRNMIIAVIFIIILVVQVSAGGGVAIGNFEDETESQCSYNASSSMYEYFLDGIEFGLSVPSGMITNEPVTASKIEAVGAKLYRNGNEVLDPEWTTGITEPGKYVITIAQNDGKYTRILFTIIGEVCGFLNEYEMPEGFYIQSATLDGEAVAYNRHHVDLIEDGVYEIVYCNPANKLTHTLKYTSQHELPTITLEGITDGKSNANVTISGLDEDEKIYIRRNNNEVEYTGELTQTGNYVITVTNDAGVQNEYEFVLIKNNGNTWISLFIGLLLLGCGIAAYVWVTRGRTKVR